MLHEVGRLVVATCQSRYRAILPLRLYSNWSQRLFVNRVFQNETTWSQCFVQSVCSKHRMEHTLISPAPFRSPSQVTFVKRIQTRKTLRKQHRRWVELITRWRRKGRRKCSPAGKAVVRLTQVPISSFRCILYCFLKSMGETACLRGVFCPGDWHGHLSSFWRKRLGMSFFWKASDHIVDLW